MRKQSLIRIATFRIDGQTYEKSTVRLGQELDSRQGLYSTATINTVDPKLIVYLQERQKNHAKISITIEADGVIETADELMIMDYRLDDLVENGIRSFECRYGKPIESQEQPQ